MKENCRVIVNQRCNYNCQYCCNKLPGMLDQFQNISMADIGNVISNYSTVCLSGGEPLMPGNIQSVSHIAQVAKSMDKRVFIYTNLSYLPSLFLIHNINGWSVGFHPTQTSVSDFIIRVYRMIAIGAKNVRVLVEDVHESMLDELVGVVHLKTWERNKCDKTAIEDWYKIVS